MGHFLALRFQQHPRKIGTPAICCQVPLALCQPAAPTKEATGWGGPYTVTAAACRLPVHPPRLPVYRGQLPKALWGVRSGTPCLHLLQRSPPCCQLLPPRPQEVHVLHVQHPQGTGGQVSDPKGKGFLRIEPTGGRCGWARVVVAQCEGWVGGWEDRKYTWVVRRVCRVRQVLGAKLQSQMGPPPCPEGAGHASSRSYGPGLH